MCQGWRQCDAPRAGLGVQSPCPCAQSPGTCVHASSPCTTWSSADTPLPFPRPVSHSTEQGLLFQHSFGDPLLASRLAFCVILESFLQSNNTHEHHNMLFFLCRTISILRSRHGKHCTTCILYEEAPETLNHRITLLSTLD